MQGRPDTTGSSLAAAARSPTARRAGVVRRALRREATRIREPKRAAAIAILVIVFALAIAGMTARGENAGSDAQAYWAAVRIWLEGGDPYHPQGPFLPYVYAPWMLPLFAPWALLPWEVAWFAWRGATILLLLWSIRWAYARRPLPTAILVAILSFPTAANLDTGNINLLLALALFGRTSRAVAPAASSGGDLDEVGAAVLARAPGARPGPRVPRPVRGAVAGDAAADDHPAQVLFGFKRGPPAPTSRVPVVGRAVWWRRRDRSRSSARRRGPRPRRSRSGGSGAGRGVRRRPARDGPPRVGAGGRRRRRFVGLDAEPGRRSRRGHRRIAEIGD
jgi:hypothetical protein